MAVTSDGGGLRFCCNSGRGASEAPCRRHSEGHRVKLIGCRRSSIFDRVELALLDHVHGLDAGKQCACAAKSLESEHRTHDAFLSQLADADNALMTKTPNRTTMIGELRRVIKRLH